MFERAPTPESGAGPRGRVSMLRFGGDHVLSRQEVGEDSGGSLGNNWARGGQDAPDQERRFWSIRKASSR